MRAAAIRAAVGMGVAVAVVAAVAVAAAVAVVAVDLATLGTPPGLVQRRRTHAN